MCIFGREVEDAEQAVAGICAGDAVRRDVHRSWINALKANDQPNLIL